MAEGRHKLPEQARMSFCHRQCVPARDLAGGTGREVAEQQVRTGKQENTEKQVRRPDLPQQKMRGSYSKRLPSGGMWVSVHGNLKCAHVRHFKTVFFFFFVVVVVLFPLG